MVGSICGRRSGSGYLSRRRTERFPGSAGSAQRRQSGDMGNAPGSAPNALGGVGFRIRCFLPLSGGRLWFLKRCFPRLTRGRTFSCVAEEKVAKKKATPRSAPGCARSLALLGAPGGCGTRPCGPQTVLADFPRHPCVAQRLSGGPRKTSLLSGQGLNLLVFRSARFAGPLGRRRATQALAEKGRALSEPRSGELRSPRQRRVAQGTRVAGADLGSPSSLATFFLAKQEESTPAGQRRNPAAQQPNTPARQAQKNGGRKTKSARASKKIKLPETQRKSFLSSRIRSAARAECGNISLAPHPVQTGSSSGRFPCPARRTP